MLFSERTVALAAVYLIRQDPFEITSETLTVFLDAPLKFGRLSFVIGIEGETVDDCITVDNAD